MILWGDIGQSSDPIDPIELDTRNNRAISVIDGDFVHEGIAAVDGRCFLVGREQSGF